MKNSLKILFGIIVVAIIVIISIFLISKLSNKEESIIRTGQIEMREYDVASKIPGRIEWIKVSEGDIVNIGQDLFKLTDREIKAKMGQAEGAVESAQAQFDMVKEGSRKEQIDMAQKKYIADKSQFDLADKTYKRMRSLHNDKLISDQEFDVIEQKYEAAQAAMEASKSQYDMALTGARVQEKRMAAGQVSRANESLEEARSYFDESILKSPLGGLVSKRYLDVGELAAVGYPVVTIIDTNDVWAELNLPATELEKLKIGMLIKGRVHGIGTYEQFKVVNFSAMADFANWRSVSDKATFDIRSFTVRLVPVNKSIPNLRPGMTVSFDLNNLK
jgi:HlyD family secretion protein